MRLIYSAFKEIASGSRLYRKLEALLIHLCDPTRVAKRSGERTAWI